MDSHWGSTTRKAKTTKQSKRRLRLEIRRSDGCLVWVSEDEDFDGGEQSYADEQEALRPAPIQPESDAAQIAATSDHRSVRRRAT